MIEFSDQLEKVMNERNFHIRGVINYNLTGKFQRFSDAGKYKKTKNLFVILHEYDRGASFGDWRFPDDWFTYWNENYDHPELAELKQHKKIMAEKKAIEVYDRSKAEWRARQFWHKFYIEKDAYSHPYILKKEIFPHFSRQYRSRLLVPVRDIDYNFKTLQFIKPDGFKRLWKKTSQKDLMIWLCDKLPDKYNGIIRICEGYATGCTIHSVTKSPVICAINSSNMPAVCVLLRRKFIHAKIKICADNDMWNDENVGLIVAMKSAKLIGADIYYPVFHRSLLHLKPTDFNDLHSIYGKNEVIRTLLKEKN